LFVGVSDVGRDAVQSFALLDCAELDGGGGLEIVDVVLQEGVELFLGFVFEDDTFGIEAVDAVIAGGAESSGWRLGALR
jgi:hypothetical protein